MATEAQLLQGLQAADAAGNTADAQHFADQIKAMRASPATSPAPGIVGTAVDMARSIPGGIVKGFSAIAGLPAEAGNLLDSGMRAVGIPTRDPSQPVPAGYTGDALPMGKGGDSTQIGNAIAQPFGGFYQPKTGLGQFSENAASFLPSLPGGEAGIGTRLMGRVLAPAAGSTLLGASVPENSPLHGVAQVGGALLGAGAFGGGRALLGALKNVDTAPSAVADQYLSRLTSQAGATPDTITATGANAVGRGMTGAEALGPSGVAALATLGRRPGATGQALADTLTTRALGAPDRVLGGFHAASGIDPNAAQGNFDAVLATGQKAAEPLYKGAYAANQNIASPTIDSILSTPAGRKAMRQASDLMQNDQSLMGVRDPDLLEQARDSGQEIPWKGGVASGLKLRSLDYVKRALDDQISSAFRAGNKTEGGVLVGLKSKLVSALDDADVTAAAGPNSTKAEGGLYARARSTAGDYLSAKQAFQDGQNHILSTTTPPSAVVAYVSKLSPTALEAYKGGIANKLLLQAQNGRLAPRIVSTPAVAQKLATVLGPDNAQKFIQGIQSEAALAKSGGRMMPGTGSITSDALLSADEQDHAATLGAGIDALKGVGHLSSGNLLAALPRIGSAVKHFAPDLYKTGGMGTEARDAAGNALMMSPQDFAAYMRNLPKLPQRPGPFAGMLGIGR